MISFIWQLTKTIMVLSVTALLWLFLLEEMGFGTWECWIR